LESRITPYVTSGGAWPQPQRVTISFVPDGTVLGYDGFGNTLTSTLQHDFNASWSTSTWENQILKAAQVWAQQTNVNFSVVSDDGAAIGSGNYQQGDPNHGDIRIGGYQEGSGCSQPLASAYMPPPLNNYDIAGNITFNTSQAFNIGMTYDLFTVAAHEFGHALGLYHSADTTAVMYGAYNGTATGLASDDISGIRAIYSSGNPRTQDGGTNNSFSTATSITIDPTALTAQVTSDISTTTDVDFYRFTAPSGSAATASISVQSDGLSLLAPKLYVYNAAHTQIAFKNGAGHYGTTLTATPSITPGATYYIKVIGADYTAFGTGAYALTINTGTGSSPTVPIPNTQTPNGNPLVTGGGQADTPGFDQFFANGDPVAVAPATPATSATGLDRAALAISLGQLSDNHSSTLVVAPNMTVADLNFQSVPLQSPQVVPFSRLTASWPEYGSGESTSDSVFQGPTAQNPDGDSVALPLWFGEI
jgi:hypothetical protein